MKNNNNTTQPMVTEQHQQFNQELYMQPLFPGTHLYGPVFPQQSQIHVNDSVEGEPIERRVERIMNNNEPITDGAPLIYTDRKDGVDPAHNIRTDRWDLALDMTDSITKQAIAKRTEFHAPKPEPTDPAPTGAPTDPPGPAK